jgi:hypothetical protein
MRTIDIEGYLQLGAKAKCVLRPEGFKSFSVPERGTAI